MTGKDLLAASAAPDAAMGQAIQALWWAERGQWDRAHEHAQADDGRDAAWVHAHLHRVEGDAENAAYWYGQAGKPVETGPLDAERQAIALALVG